VVAEVVGDRPVRVALADDQALVLKGLSALLSEFEDLQIVLEATDGDRLLDGLRQRPVDVVVSDIRMPGADGHTLLERVREHAVRA
jgi:DNA-binding NarL/FixJ family response regulator